MAADGKTALDALNYGTSVGGAAGSSETSSTLGVDRADQRVPPDTFRVWGAQLNAVKNLLLLMSQYDAGGTRLKALAQSANPFGSGEGGFWHDGTNAKFTNTAGTITTLGAGGGGSTGNYVFSANNVDLSGTANATIGGAHVSGLQLTQTASTSGSPYLFQLVPGAHTTLAASTEATDFNINLARAVQFATGALTTQRAALFQAPTYGFVGASTITNAATVAITGAPVAGTNATITNPWALWVQAGTVRFDGSFDNSASVGTFSTGTGTVTLNGNTTTASGKSITVTAQDVNARHAVPNGGSPSVAAGAGAGTGPSAALVAGKDEAGELTVTFGSAVPTATPNPLVTVTYANAFATDSHGTFVPADSTTANAMNQFANNRVLWATSNASGFTINISTAAAPTGTWRFKWTIRGW